MNNSDKNKITKYVPATAATFNIVFGIQRDIGEITSKIGPDGKAKQEYIGLLEVGTISELRSRQ